MLEKKGYYAAIRCTEGREWIDMGSIGCDRDDVETKEHHYSISLPGWCEVNPLVRIVPIVVTEVAE